MMAHPFMMRYSRLVCANGIQFKENADDLERQNARLAEKLRHLESTAQQKADAAAAENEQLRAKLLEMKRKKIGAAAAASEEEVLAAELRQRLDSEGQAQRQQLHALLAAWRRLDQTVRTHQSSLVS